MGLGSVGARVVPRDFIKAIWEFPKIGDPHIVPHIVGSLV